MDDSNEAGPYEYLASRHEWTRIIRRARLGSRGKTKEIALLLASYGNVDGTRCFAGIRRLAAVGECDEKTAKRCLNKLRTLGLITLVESGSHHGRPKKGHKPRNDEYILTIPPDIEERVEMLPPDELDPEREMELQEERRADAVRRREKRRIEREAAKGSAKGSAEGSPNPRETPANPRRNTECQGTPAAYQGTSEPVSGDTSPRIRGQLDASISAATSEDDAYQIVGPASRRPGKIDHHPASVKRASADALADIEDDHNDEEPNDCTAFGAAFEEIAAEFGYDVTPREADRIRSSLERGEPVEGIIYAVRFVRRMQARRDAA